MRKTLTILALLLSSLMFASPAEAQSIRDAGTATCSSNCPTGLDVHPFLKYAALNNLNCNGEGNTRNPNGPNCPLGDNYFVKINYVAPNVSQTYWYKTTQIQEAQNPPTYILTPTVPPNIETTRVYYQPFCIGVYVDTLSFAEAQSIEGGISFTIFTPPENPDPMLCWYIATEGSH